ncbi:MAG: hypothetical protein CMQ74_07360 [Gammaproteobacteria bacterium]|nr:hypothetical protein [Gammaproteobacteria bacterium]|tara:strand:+ start:736 stop:1248 length:513 start_codon:yes stop_codon:yes gene_type:complete
MCEAPDIPGPFDNLWNDAVGVTAAKNEAKEAAKEQERLNQIAEQRNAEIEANRLEQIRIANAATAAQQEAAAAGSAAIQEVQQQAETAFVVGGSANAAEISERNAAISAANSAATTSQGILSKQKKKKKGLRISPKDAYAKGEGSAGTTSASLKIGSQGVAAGTGTNLPV